MVEGWGETADKILKGKELIVWKVYNIATGRIAKAGFDSEDQAKDWLERRKELADDEFDIDEMDDEEEEEFLENEANDSERGGAFDGEEDEEIRDISYPEEPLDVEEDDVDGDDEDEEDDVEDEEEDD